MSMNVKIVDSDSDSWERFMILWGSTPEIFIGSCIASLMGIIITWFITRNVSRTVPSMERPEVAKKRVKEETSHEEGEKGERADEREASRSACKKTLYKFASDKLEKSLTNEQMNEEKETKRKQLEAIYNLMKDQKDLFGIDNLNQIEEQMKLYG